MGSSLTPAVRWLARASAAIFYRIERVGPRPPAGPLLLLPNHPNALLDSAVVWTTAGRDIRFLAKSTLFSGPFAPVLNAGGAIPVYRRIDQEATVSRNAETFAVVSAALAAGDAICIFPEGISHSSGRLEPLRTGAARMALAAERNGTAVALMGVGLNFDRKTTFRSRVTIVYGAPFSCADLAAGDERPEATRLLTERIAGHMRDLIVEAEPSADAALVDRVDRLYAAARGRPFAPQERIERRRLIASGIERLRATDRARYDALLLRIRRYDQRLRRFGLHDRHLDWKVTTADAVRFAIREATLACVLMPLSAAGLLLFFVPYHATAFIARRFTRERDVIATAQLFSGAAVYAAWIGALTFAAYALAGRTGAFIALVLLPLVALTSLRAIERESEVLASVRAWWLLRRARDETKTRLRRHRSELANVLDDVRAWLFDE